MSTEDGSKPSTPLLAAYLQGEVTASETARIEAELDADTGTRRRLDQLRHIRDALSAPIPELENVDLVAGVQAALRKPAPNTGRGGRMLMWGAGAAAAVASLTGVLWGVLPREPLDSEFRAKSGDGSVEEGRRWAGIQVHRVQGSSLPERVTERLSARDGLVFSYTNLGPEPFDYLMLFAVDALGKVYWFYPPYERHGDDPIALRIDRSTSEAPLRDVVQHDFATGPLSIYGLFSRRPLRVSQVEAWLGEHGGRIASVTPLPETSLHTVMTRVEP